MQLAHVVILLAFFSVILVDSVNVTVNVNATLNEVEEEARAFLSSYDEEASIELYESYVASWAYNTNVTDENAKLQTAAELKEAAFEKEAWKNASQIDWRELQDESMKRQFKEISVLGIAILEPGDLEKLTTAISEMEGIYAKTVICSYNDSTSCNLRLDPEITEIMASSRNYEELKHVWKEWHEKAGRPMRPIYPSYVGLENKAAEMNGFHNLGEMWLDPYESETFTKDIEELWQELRPFYLHLHAYVRRKLRLFYGNDKVSENGPIPAHILGNMWSQQWDNIYDITVPFPDKKLIDVTQEMKNQGYDVLKMFHISDEFFASLGLIPLNDLFWNNSLLERPTDREVVCHASAWDFHNGKDFRIKMCTTITMDDLITIHHEMGHIQYFMQYKDQPIMFRNGANPGFHEAVGDTLALSVSTPQHLQKISLLKTSSLDYESTINFLFLMALNKLAFLPFGYAVDKWRWDVFAGNITQENYNEKWWEIRKELQGIVPPVSRSEEDFDPGAKYHVASDTAYISYFVSYVIQFQFYKAMCKEAEVYVPGDASKPLYDCDFYQNKDAGELLSNMLRLGSSLPWPKAMEVITKGESNKMDASAYIEYFQPLILFLEKENEKNQEYVGWDGPQ